MQMRSLFAWSPSHDLRLCELVIIKVAAQAAWRYALIQMLEKCAENSDRAKIICKARVCRLLTNAKGDCVGCECAIPGCISRSFGKPPRTASIYRRDPVDTDRLAAGERTGGLERASESH